MNKERDTPRKAFKDYFDKTAATRLAAQIHSVWPPFDQRRFLRLATTKLAEREFQARVQAFSDALAATLPPDRPQALTILTQSLPPVLPDCEAITDGWLQWPIGQFIADHGLPHAQASIQAMIALTMRFSSEFAVRPFLLTLPDLIYPQIRQLTRHPNPHVRRWCSEGTRPRLPWGKRLPAVIADPSPSWPILEALKDDPERYVQKSVANHLNDIAKDHPGLVIATCRRWKEKAPPSRLWIIRHGLRSLIKAGHPEALALLGFIPGNRFHAMLSIQPDRAAIGETITFVARIENRQRTPVRAIVDYIIHYVRPSGRSSSKVFKWTRIELTGQGSLQLTKKHALRQARIRTLYPGQHRVELQVNGQRIAKSAYLLHH